MFLSALTVVLSLAAVFVVPVMVFRSMALGMILSVVAVAAAALTLLPALLVALGDRVLVKKGQPDTDVVAESRWARWTRRVAAPPRPRPRRRPHAARRPRDPGVRDAPRHARSACRRHRPQQPRRLRHARQCVRTRRRGPRIHHRAGRRRGDRREDRRRRRPAWSTHASSRPRRRRVGSSCGSPAPLRSTTHATATLVHHLRSALAHRGPRRARGRTRGAERAISPRHSSVARRTRSDSS